MQVLVDKGIRTCTVVWSVDGEEDRKTVIDRLGNIRPTIRYELGQRLCFKTVPELVFAGIE